MMGEGSGCAGSDVEEIAKVSRARVMSAISGSSDSSGSCFGGAC